jgi:hypothetical protein
MTKTSEEIDALKSQWRADPCWDIWTTEGFEDHEQELREYQAKCELEWKNNTNIEFIEFQKLSGTTRNKKLAKFLYAMGMKIKKLEEDNDKR